MRGPCGITRRGLASLAAGALAACLCGCEAGGDPSGASEQGARWRVIDSSGDWVGTARFSDADGYGFASNGLAAVQDPTTDLWGYVDSSGGYAIELCFSEAKWFSPNGLAPACDTETGLWGYIGKSGEWAIEPRYADAWSFYENGTAFVLDAERERTTWINEKGEILEGRRSPRPQAREDPASGLWGIIAEDGTWALEPAFADLATDGHSDYLLARPQGSGLCGVVDAGGGWVVGPAYADLVVAFDAGVLAAKDADTGLWGYVGWDGGWVVQPAFAE
ncbi:WG repeat-containing protein, partial [Olsenella sp. Marseille-P4559]|uniref:WG repeat-containing protein n=1 Tax=Olsenella sp. Marseille-P4559 TaxID=2364795 RepID=UPI0010323754